MKPLKLLALYFISNTCTKQLFPSGNLNCFSALAKWLEVMVTTWSA